MGRKDARNSINRSSPEYLFIYTPTSFGWHRLMLKGNPSPRIADPAKAGKTTTATSATDKAYYYTATA
jgi:hypothetical protein